MTRMLAVATWAEAHAKVKTVGNAAWGSTVVSLPEMAGKVINVALSFLGLLFLLQMLYAGFKWMTARGDEKAVSDAKDTIKNMVIGMIIIIGAYAITNFVMGSLLTAVS